MLAGRIFTIAMGLVAATSFAGQEPSFDLQLATPRIGASVNTLVNQDTKPPVPPKAPTAPESPTAPDANAQAKELAEAKKDAEDAMSKALDEAAKEPGVTPEMAKTISELLKGMMPEIQKQIEFALSSKSQMTMGGHVSPEMQKNIEIRIKHLDEKLAPRIKKHIEIRMGKIKPGISPDIKREIEIEMKGIPNEAKAYLPNDFAVQLEKMVSEQSAKGVTPSTDQEIEFSTPAMPPRPPMSPIEGNSPPADFERVIRSLTAEQRSVIRQHGYIKSSELSSTQRRWLGLPLRGHFVMSYTNGTRKIVIKSN